MPCNCKQCQGLAQPRAFEQRELLRRKEHGKFKVECPGSFEYVDVLELLDGIRVDRLPGWAKDEAEISRAEARSYQPPRTIKIFIASSSELRQDRDDFELYFRQQNDAFRKKGVYKVSPSPQPASPPSLRSPRRASGFSPFSRREDGVIA